MREIVILSGKGGTGKTSVAGSLALVAGKTAVIADCDVDAADLHLILKPERVKEEDFYSGYIAEIDFQKCSNCGRCLEVCRFGAVQKKKDQYYIDPVKCEGCGYCSYICPRGSIGMSEQKVGKLYHSHIRTGSLMIHASLGIGADNSGKLVARVKKDAQTTAEQNGYKYIIVDGSPGIGCPVISSLSGADFVLLITEPTRSALHDLKRVWELSQRFHLPAGCIINKADLNAEIRAEIEVFLQRNKILHLASLPYDNDFQRAITEGVSLVEYNSSKWSSCFQAIWQELSQTKEN
jgi:MinD superfamily P-loop ATPase